MQSCEFRQAHYTEGLSSVLKAALERKRGVRGKLIEEDNTCDIGPAMGVCTHAVTGLRKDTLVYL